MARTSDPQTLKQEALLALDRSRAALSGEWAIAREQWNLRHFIQQNLEKHRVAIIVAAGAAGFAAMRWFFPGRENRRDTFSKPARKRTFGSFLLNGLWGMWREPLLAVASQQLMPLVMKFLSEFQSPPKPPSSE